MYGSDLFNQSANDLPSTVFMCVQVEFPHTMDAYRTPAWTPMMESTSGSISMGHWIPSPNRKTLSLLRTTVCVSPAETSTMFSCCSLVISLNSLDGISPPSPSRPRNPSPVE